MPRKKTPYEKVYDPSGLYIAWQQVYKSGISGDAQTKDEIRRFNHNLPKKIIAISRDLQKRQFVFSNNKEYLQGKKNRPIVRSPIESRIVQRALLNILQSDKNLKSYYRNKGNFGCIPSEEFDSKGVEAAIREMADCLNKGAKYYYKSNIKQFYTKIPRLQIIKIIKNVINDDEFEMLFR